MKLPRHIVVSLAMLTALLFISEAYLQPTRALMTTESKDLPTRAASKDKLYDYLARYAAVINLTHQKQYGPLLPAAEKLCADFLAEGLDRPIVSEKFKSPSGLSEVTPLIRVPKSYGNAWSRLYLEILETRAIARSHSSNKLSEALADHKKVLAESPDFIEARVGLATHYRLVKQFDKALEEVDRALAKNPRHYIAWTTKAMIYQDMGNTAKQQEALEESYKVSASEEREINSFMKMPSDHNQAPDPRNALRLINFRPRNANAIATYAESINPPRTNDALKYATIAVNMDPSGALVRQIRADINLDLGNFIEAATDATIATKADPDDLDTRITRGLAYSNINKPNEALADLDFVIKRQPNYTDAYNYRAAILLSSGDAKRALSDAKKAVTLEPEYSLAYSYLGACYSRLGLIDDAKQAFETAVRLERKFRGYAASLPRFNLGYCYLKQNQPELANHEFDQALLADPLAAQKLFTRCCSAAQLGCRDAELKTALTTGLLPKFPLVDSEKIKDSVILLTRLVEVNPRKIDARFDKGLSSLCLNDSDSALAEFKSLLRLNQTGIDPVHCTALMLLAAERNNPLQTEAKIFAKELIDKRFNSSSSRKSSPFKASRAMISLTNFLLGQENESQVLANSVGIADGTRLHSYLAFHYLSVGERAKAKQHLEWTLLQGDRKSPAFILALMELQRYCGKR